MSHAKVGLALVPTIQGQMLIVLSGYVCAEQFPRCFYVDEKSQAVG